MFKAFGEPGPWFYDGTKYFYQLNLQGDVIGIIDTTGASVAKYAYDAWGRVVYNTGSMAAINPIRYRGYYYDAELGMYYLQSRYYDPTLKRFINADGFASTGKKFLGYNMFAYCNNNPVNRSDPTGNLPDWVYKYFGTEWNYYRWLEYGIYWPVMIAASGGYVDTQTPPPPETGYTPPKKNPTPDKVKNPNGSGRGWPAQDGGVWVPDNTMDGGPGWTVQYPDGSHEHRYPDGHVRKHGNARRIVGGAIMLGAGIAILVIAADDITGAGIANDSALPSLISGFTKGAEMLLGG